MILRENCLLADDSILMKYHAFIFVIFEKNSKISNCRLLQIIGGALRVNLLGYQTHHIAYCNILIIEF